MIKYVLSTVISLTFLFGGFSNAATDNDAKRVHLRKDCSENNELVANCFTEIADLQLWISNDRDPNAGHLLVDIGPGMFRQTTTGSLIGGFVCSNMSDITLRGSGPGNTILGGDVSFEYPDGSSGESNSSFGLMAQYNCANLNVQDLTLWGVWGINWDGDGNSNYSNVEVVAGLYGWRETCANNTESSVHRWNGGVIRSKDINTNMKAIYEIQCSENWFFGTQLINSGLGMAATSSSLSGLTMINGSEQLPNEIHVYGGNIRLVANPYLSGASMTAVNTSTPYGEIHIHGTGIDVIGNGNDNTITALKASNGGILHASQSSFVLQNSQNGVTNRIVNDGSGIVMAPYLWEDGVLNRSIKSSDGADMAIEMVCSGGSSCQPHVMVYSNNCDANGPWFDTTANTCRQ